MRMMMGRREATGTEYLPVRFTGQVPRGSDG